MSNLGSRGQQPNIGDFLKVMEEDVKKSRNKDLDPGCLRFDFFKDRADPNKFYFYEAYVDDEAAAAHKLTDHYKNNLRTRWNPLKNYAFL